MVIILKDISESLNRVYIAELCVSVVFFDVFIGIGHDFYIRHLSKRTVSDAKYTLRRVLAQADFSVRVSRVRIRTGRGYFLGNPVISPCSP